MSSSPQLDDREFFQQLVTCINKQIIAKATHYKILLHENAIKSLVAYRRKHPALIAYSPEQFTSYLYNKIDKRLTKIADINESTNRNEEQIIKKILESLFIDDCKSIDQKIDAHEIKVKVKRFDKFCNLENEEQYFSCWEKTFQALQEEDHADKKKIIVDALRLTLIDKSIHEAVAELDKRYLDPIPDGSAAKRNKGDRKVIETENVKVFLAKICEKAGDRLSFSDYDDFFIVKVKTHSGSTAEVKFNVITNAVAIVDDKWNIGEQIAKQNMGPIDQLKKTIEHLMSK